MVTVADNGIGIAAHDLGRLFQPFQRLNLQRLYEGSGLGLALARQIAEAHGGSITVASTPGQGSQFTVTLPAADSAPAR
jgi:signal transduction histidine kinase